MIMVGYSLMFIYTMGSSSVHSKKWLMKKGHYKSEIDVCVYYMCIPSFRHIKILPNYISLQDALPV